MRITPPSPAATVADRCRGLLAGLPGEPAGLQARTVSPASPYTRAWGQPAVILRCGDPPRPVPADAQLFDVSGASGGTVAWYPTEDTRSTTFTATRGGLQVTVVVPDDYQGADVLAALTPTVSLVLTG